MITLKQLSRYPFLDANFIVDYVVENVMKIILLLNQNTNAARDISLKYTEVANMKITVQVLSHATLSKKILK